MIVDWGRGARVATQAVDVMAESSRVKLCCVPADSSEDEEDEVDIEAAVG
jgi:hypothetical protein